ncbi:MAG: hypothetical protein R3E79_59290 [Caldilineaceae bacterium]
MGSNKTKTATGLNPVAVISGGHYSSLPANAADDSKIAWLEKKNGHGMK